MPWEDRSRVADGTVGWRCRLRRDGVRVTAVLILVHSPKPPCLGQAGNVAFHNVPSLPPERPNGSWFCLYVRLRVP